MKKLLLTASAVTLAFGMNAETYSSIQSATLQHEGTEQVFYGNGAFAAAYAAAADTLDVIYLSAGSFSNPGQIKKSITVYGVGFEADPESDIQRTYVAGDCVLNPDTDESNVNGCHFEGIAFEGNFNVNRVQVDGVDKHVHNLSIIKCETGHINLSAPTHYTTIRQSRLRGVLAGNNTCAAQSLVAQNCFIQGRVYNFPVTVDALSSVLIDHCILTLDSYNQSHGPYVYSNCIVDAHHYTQIESGATINGTVYFGRNDLGVGKQGSGNYFLSNWAEVFTDAENIDYTAERTFTVNEELVGVDGEPVGVVGGKGWHKFTSLPRIKELGADLSEDGKTLTVTIKADVPE